MQVGDRIIPSLSKPLAAASKEVADQKNTSLGDSFEKVLSDTNQQLIQAEEKKTEFVTSDNKDIHGTMIAMQKAEVSMKMLLRIRSKLTTAYEEVMRMQI